MSDIFGGVLDFGAALADLAGDIAKGHDGSNTEVTDYGSDGLEFVIDVLKGVTKCVGGAHDRAVINDIIKGLETAGTLLVIVCSNDVFEEKFVPRSPSNG